MQTDGTLTRWNKERGSGYITPRRGGQDVSVHIAAFPEDGRPPQLHEKLSFVIETDKSGKKRAVNVVRLEERDSASRGRRGQAAPRRNQSVALLAPLALMLAIGVYGYVGLYEKTDLWSVLGIGGKIGSTSGSETQGTTTNFFCDGRTTCAQMTSCEEATFFLRHCPNVSLEVNQEGIPCVPRWCGGASR
jgi:cold shock CspA family protein